MLEHGHDDEGLKWTKEILRTTPSRPDPSESLAEYYRARRARPGELSPRHGGVGP